MPRVAALLDVMQVSDITKVVAPDTFERPIYAGNAHRRPCRARDAKKVITVRAAAFKAAASRRRGADRGGRRRRRRARFPHSSARRSPSRRGRS